MIIDGIMAFILFGLATTFLCQNIILGFGMGMFAGVIMLSIKTNDKRRRK